MKKMTGIIIPKNIEKEYFVDGIEIKKSNQTVFYFDKKNKQLIVQSPPLMGKIFYIPFKQINFL